jgi:hypothetical protein
MNDKILLKSIFDAEMNSLLNTPDASVQTCLISGNILDESHITLLCGHAFNYRSIYDEVVQQKSGYNGLEVVQLGKNNLKCPYCKNVQGKLLPYITIEGVKRIPGVNAPESSCMNLYKCPYIMKSGKRKGERCNKGCNTKFCKLHKEQKPSPAKPSVPSKTACACKTSKGTKCKRSGTIEIENETTHSILNGKHLHICKQHHQIYSNIFKNETEDIKVGNSLKILFGM